MIKKMTYFGALTPVWVRTSPTLRYVPTLSLPVFAGYGQDVKKKIRYMYIMNTELKKKGPHTTQ